MGEGGSGQFCGHRATAQPRSPPTAAFSLGPNTHWKGVPGHQTQRCVRGGVGKAPTCGMGRGSPVPASGGAAVLGLVRCTHLPAQRRVGGPRWQRGGPRRHTASSSGRESLKAKVMPAAPSSSPKPSQGADDSLPTMETCRVKPEGRPLVSLLEHTCVCMHMCVHACANIPRASPCPRAKVSSAWSLSRAETPQTALTLIPKGTSNPPRKILLWVKPCVGCGTAWGEPALGLRLRSRKTSQSANSSSVDVHMETPLPRAEMSRCPCHRGFKPQLS